MPLGIIINALSVIIGGLAGGFASKRIKLKAQGDLIVVIGICAIGMGITSVVKVKSVPVVILAVLAGFVIGNALGLDAKINKFFRKLLSKIGSENKDAAYLDKLVVISVIFCFSSTGIYGALLSGMTGDHSILLGKSVLDLFTSFIFALSLSYIVATLGLIQPIVLMTIFLLSKFIAPLLTDTMIADFIACGGIILVATGLKVAGIKDIKIADMIPALIIVAPLSYLFSLFL